VTTAVYTKPLPVISPENTPFWDAVREHRFVAPRCRDCGDFGWIPYIACRTCLSTDLEWVDLSGRATIYSYSIVYRGPGAFNDDVPYILVLAEMEERPRPMLVLAQLVDCPLEEARIGMPVRVAYTDIEGEDVTLYSFVPDHDDPKAD
jgi:uncharacterized OB-fold protein